MRGMLKKIIVIVFAVVMAIANVPITSMARVNDDTVEVDKVTDITTLSLGQSVDINIDAKGNSDSFATAKWFKFTPTTTDDYVFYSEGDYDTYVALYKKEDGMYKLLEYEDDSLNGYNFSLLYELTAGKDYYYCASTFDDLDEADFSVCLRKKRTFKSVTFEGNYTPGLKDTTYGSNLEICMNYTDGSKCYGYFYVSISNGTYTDAINNPEGEFRVDGDDDEDGYSIELLMTAKDVVDCYKGVARKYNAKVKVYKDGTDVGQVAVAFEMTTIESYFKNAKTISVGDVMTTDNYYESLYACTPYKLVVDEDSNYIFEKINGYHESSNIYVYYLYPLSNEGYTYYNYSTWSLNTSNYIEKGTYYIIFNSQRKNANVMFGYHADKAYIPTKSISAPKELSLEVGASKNIGAKCLPEISNEGMTFNSDNEKVATVDGNGNVKAISAGTAVITIKSHKVKVTCKVTVKEKQEVVVNKNNTITVKSLNKKLKAKNGKLAKKTKIKIASKASALGGAKLTFKKTKGSSKIKVSSAGVVTVSKGLKKGKYTIKIKITSSEVKGYKKTSVTKKMVITVK